MEGDIHLAFTVSMDFRDLPPIWTGWIQYTAGFYSILRGCGSLPFFIMRFWNMDGFLLPQFQ